MGFAIFQMPEIQTFLQSTAIEHHVYTMRTSQNTSQNITCTLRLSSKHKFRRLSYVREHRKIHHRTSYVYYVNIVKFIVEHRLNNRRKIQATEVQEMCRFILFLDKDNIIFISQEWEYCMYMQVRNHAKRVEATYRRTLSRASQVPQLRMCQIYGACLLGRKRPWIISQNNIFSYIKPASGNNPRTFQPKRTG